MNVTGRKQQNVKEKNCHKTDNPLNPVKRKFVI